jgi:cobalamin synthase
VVVVICCQLGAWQSCVAAGFTIGSALLAAYWLSAKLGGQTGDTYGTVVELSETCALVLSAVSLPLIRFH